jgi:hypothetical protein
VEAKRATTRENESFIVNKGCKQRVRYDLVVRLNILRTDATVEIMPLGCITLVISVKKKVLENLVCFYVSTLLCRAIQCVGGRYAVSCWHGNLVFHSIERMIHRVEQDTHQPTEGAFRRR